MIDEMKFVSYVIEEGQSPLDNGSDACKAGEVLGKMIVRSLNEVYEDALTHKSKGSCSKEECDFCEFIKNWTKQKDDKMSCGELQAYRNGKRDTIKQEDETLKPCITVNPGGYIVLDGNARSLLKAKMKNKKNSAEDKLLNDYLESRKKFEERGKITISVRLTADQINRFINPEPIIEYIWGPNCWGGDPEDSVGLVFCPLCGEENKGGCQVDISEGLFFTFCCNISGTFVQLIEVGKQISTDEARQLITDIVINYKSESE